jgi:hypothetical protein
MHSVPERTTVTDAELSMVCVHRPVASPLAEIAAACAGINEKVARNKDMSPIPATLFIVKTFELLNFYS